MLVETFYPSWPQFHEADARCIYAYIMSYDRIGVGGNKYDNVIAYMYDPIQKRTLLIGC